jgi:hypothetical protein
MQNELKFSAVVQYFEDLAKQHVTIAHSQTHKAFFRLELDEVVEGLRNNINYPALVLEGYDINFKDNRSDNVIKQRGTAFIIVKRVARGDFNAIHAAYDEMEEIGDDILARMRHDKSQRRSPIRDFNMDNVEATIINWFVDSGLYGIRYNFTIDSTFDTDMNPDKWQDNG